MALYVSRPQVVEALQWTDDSGGARMSRESYRLLVVSQEEAREWRRPLWEAAHHQAITDAIEESGDVRLYFWNEREVWGDTYPDELRFTWYCPGCGGSNGGTLGEQPVSGWDNPRWVRSGDDEHLSLTPSLGCPLWRTGACIGHWWARDGRLVLA